MMKCGPLQGMNMVLLWKIITSPVHETKTIIAIAQYTPNNVFCFFVVADTSASFGSTLQLIFITLCNENITHVLAMVDFILIFRHNVM